MEPLRDQPRTDISPEQADDLVSELQRSLSELQVGSSAIREDVRDALNRAAEEQRVDRVTAEMALSHPLWAEALLDLVEAVELPKNRAGDNWEKIQNLVFEKMKRFGSIVSDLALPRDEPFIPLDPYQKVRFLNHCLDLGICEREQAVYALLEASELRVIERAYYERWMTVPDSNATG
jgi:hypothetical protein